MGRPAEQHEITYGEIEGKGVALAHESELTCEGPRAPGLHLRAGDENSPGSARRLAAVLMQFDLTYDLHELTAEGLIEMLPKEFSKFLK